MSRGGSAASPHRHDRYLVELRDHGAYGVEAQFWQNEEFSYSQRFETRALAVQWAEEERKFLVNGGGLSGEGSTYAERSWRPGGTRVAADRS